MVWRGGTSKMVERRWQGREGQARAAWVLACDLAADELHGDLRKVVQGTGKVGRGSDDLTAECRKLACYLAVTVADVPPPALEGASGLHRRTIHKHLQSIEDRRDEPVFDAQVRRLGRVLIGMCARVVLANLDELEGEEA